MHKNYVFDFDGVICDSNLETYEISLLSFIEITQSSEKIIKEKNLFNNYLLNRYKARRPSDFFLLWYNILKKKLQLHIEINEFLLKKYEQIFFQRRLREKNKNKKKWLTKNKVYPNVVSFIINYLSINNVFIASTKDETSIIEILKYNNINLPKENIYGSEEFNDKADMFHSIKKKSNNYEINFIDDNEENINTALKYNFNCFYATWGYGKAKSIKINNVVNLSLDTIIKFK